MRAIRTIDYDHIRPIWDALDADGQFYVRPGTQRPGTTTRGLPHSDVPLIVAGYPDLRRTRRPVIFVEHGAGETYGLSDPHYAGGANRDRVELFLCPNERVASANDTRYPGRSVVVGSPRVEWLATIDRDGEPSSAKGRGEVRDGHPLRVVVSFHWNCTIHPQARTAMPHYQPHFGGWATDSRIEVRGHSHPRMANQAERIFAASGIEFISDFTDVIRWADVYAVDNSSTLFEAVACGLDAVVLDAPWYTRENTGFRFWKYADIGPRIQDGEKLVDAALSANYGYADIRNQAVVEVFGSVRGATDRAVAAIERLVGSSHALA